MEEGEVLVSGAKVIGLGREGGACGGGVPLGKGCHESGGFRARERRGGGGWGFKGSGERNLLVVPDDLACGLDAGGEGVVRRHAIRHEEGGRCDALQLHLQQ